MADDTRAERIVRVDAAIACHRIAELAAIWVDHEDEASYHESEVNRLMRLRDRIVRRTPMTVVEVL